MAAAYSTLTLALLLRFLVSYKSYLTTLFLALHFPGLIIQIPNHSTSLCPILPRLVLSPLKIYDAFARATFIATGFNIYFRFNCDCSERATNSELPANRLLTNVQSLARHSVFVVIRRSFIGKKWEGDL